MARSPTLAARDARGDRCGGHGDVHETSAETAGGWQIAVCRRRVPQFGPKWSTEVGGADDAAARFAGLERDGWYLREMNRGQPATEFRPNPASCGPRQFAAPVLCVAGGGVCGVGRDSGFAGNLRSDLVLGDPPDQGDWNPDGAGSDDGERDVGGDCQNSSVGSDWNRRRHDLVSCALSRTMAALLFGTEPTDPVTFGAMILLLAGVALTAGYIPARRASRINPTIALRNS